MMKKQLLGTTAGFLLLGLLVLFSIIAWNRDPQGVSTQQVASAACLTASDAGFVFEFYGYIHNEDGTATLTYSVTNPNKKDISYVAFGTEDWARLEPSNGVTTTLELGTYQVEWTNDRGNPGFTSVKYETQFGGFSNGASDRFTLVVSSFDPDATMQIEAKAGRNRGRVSFALDDPACDKTPPTPTPTPPFSPLPTPTPTPEGGVVLPTEPVVAECLFGPPAGGLPPAEPVIPLSAYSFSEPQVVLTNTAPIGIQRWLPDSETLLVTRHTGYGNKLELLNTQTGKITELLEPNRGIDTPKWLSTNQSIAWRELGAPGYSAGYWIRSYDPPGERRLSDNSNGAGVPHDSSPDGKEFIFMGLPGGTQPFIWNQENQSLRSLPIDLSHWRHANGPTYPLQPFNVSWQPNSNMILFWDGTWTFLYDLTTNSGCEIHIRTLTKYFLYRYIHKASWSPNGRYLLFKNAEYPLYTSTYGPHDFVLILDTYTGESVQYALGNSVYNLFWAPDNQTVAIVKRTERQIQMADGTLDYRTGMSLFNIHTGQQQQILPTYSAMSEHGLVWSPDGTKLAFLGSTLDRDDNRGPGGVQISLVTTQP